MRAAKLLSFQLALVVLLSAGAFAGSKEDAARDLLAKSFQQANLWTDGPVKLVAKVRMPKSKNQDLNLTYEISWAGPDRWRAEWSGAGYSRITVLANGKLYRSSSLPAPPLSVVQFEEALGALYGNSPAAPSISPPFDLRQPKLQVSNERAGNTNVKCVSFGSTWCIDPVSAHVLNLRRNVSAHGLSSEFPEQSTFEYDNYARVGEVEFPQLLRLRLGRDVKVEGTITVSRDATFADSFFAAPPNSITSDFPSCADVDKNFLSPHLEKRVQPAYPQNERISGHQGTVWLYATVGKDGTIQHLQVIRGAAWLMLNKSATDAVQQWKYSPYKRCGQPVEGETVIAIDFFLVGP